MLKKLMEPFRYPRPEAAASRGESLHPPAQHGMGRLAERAGGGKPKQRAKDAAGTLKRIWRYLIQYRAKLIAVMAMVLFSTGLALLGPYLIGTAIDRFIVERGSGMLLFLLGIAAVYSLQALTTWLQSIWMITISQRTVLSMRRELFNHLQRLPIPYFAKRQHGETMSRMTNDIENVSATLNSSVISVFSSVLLLVGIVGVMLSLSPLLTLLTFLVVPLMALGMKWITNRTSRMFRAQQRNLGELNGYVEETLSGQRIIKAFSQEETVIREFRQRNERIRLSGFWAQAISGFIPKLMSGLNNLSFAIIAGIGGMLALKGGTITVGVIIIFAEYSRQFTRPLNDLANQWNTMLSAVAGAERVFQVLDEEVESSDESGAEEVRSVEGKVVFRDVSFSYEAGGDTLKHVSFTAAPGETVAFVGPTGAGKTTLISLLSRFYEPTTGAIEIDDRDIRTMKRASLRSQMAFVLQDPFLFEGTIADNIRYGKLDASDKEVEEAAKLANAHGFISRMKGGYNALLKGDGAGISQGQKQLLAIARAILANPSILVLDEATSSIDTVTEIKIQEALQRLMEGRTSFIIAHRLNTIQQADQIVVLQNGTVAEKGSHEVLTAKGGFYSGLVHGQYVLEP
ncbi:ABC transporter ATP-binding protein/permease [Paenibacillus sp. J5C_2022]|uniref:ABC transporter ATP-binding protein n=1 Tax=Paenibacillus sp. J5C2022 TaxID=2977129 RepID=UPI0021CFE73C|nr:ABC transporter ATP-binding protein [Paenibacillus sp. J5C2022]MCU6709904.1 ABC transporter ATP-binding protein/permease [Paenibacillus sp. J5C2022]